MIILELLLKRVVFLRQLKNWLEPKKTNNHYHVKLVQIPDTLCETHINLAGGQPVNNTLRTSEILREDQWQESVDLSPYQFGLGLQCMVQISHCETAIIGGLSTIGNRIFFRRKHVI